MLYLALTFYARVKYSLITFGSLHLALAFNEVVGLELANRGHVAYI